MSEQRTGRLNASLTRLSIVGVLAAALIAGGLLDRGSGQGASSPVLVVQPVPIAAPVQALSSSWFCAGATDYSNGPAPGSVIIANDGPNAAIGVVTLVPSGGAKTTVPVSVAPGTQATVAETVPGGSRWIGAIVDMDAGAVAVLQQVNGSLGRSSEPCATAGSALWYFPTGATLVNASEIISLLNPYPTDAVANLSFSTEAGPEAPQEFQGLVVPAGSLLSVNVGDHLRRRHTIATTVTAQSGRLVAWKTEVVTPAPAGAPLIGSVAASQPLADPAAPVPGLTLALGSPSTATKWTWPEGVSGNGVNEQYVIYNPGSRIAELQLSLQLDQGVAEPFSLSVGPEEAIPVVSNQEVRIPAGVNHAAVLTSLNGVPVVAERTLDASSPSPWSGLGELPGERIAATSWLVAANGSDRNHNGLLVMYNPGASQVRADVVGLNITGQAVLDTITIGPHRRAAVDLGAVGPDSGEPVVVNAGAPIFVESDSYGRGRTPGVNLSYAVPLSS